MEPSNEQYRAKLRAAVIAYDMQRMAKKEGRLDIVEVMNLGNFLRR